MNHSVSRESAKKHVNNVIVYCCSCLADEKFNCETNPHMLMFHLKTALQRRKTIYTSEHTQAVRSFLCQLFSWHVINALFTDTVIQKVLKIIEDILATLHQTTLVQISFNCLGFIAHLLI